jgi:voltage-gated potassium channel
MSQHRIDELLSVFGLLKRSAYRIVQYCVLAIGLTAMTAMTLPDLSTRSATWLAVTLWCCLGFFAVELTIKSWPRDGAKIAASYLLTAAGVIDLLAVLPIPLALLFGVSTGTAWLLASLWLLKLAPVLTGLSGQPEQFGSLPRALWWSVTTLTTTGYGDAVPETFLGRTIAALVMICGLGMFGLWTGILATGFAAESRRRDFVRNWDLVASVPFLRNLDAPAIIELTRMLRPIDLAASNTVVRRGRPGDCMYFIASGEVEVRVEPHPVRLGAGAFFGEFALLDGSPRTATVVTTMPSTLLILDVSDFRAFTAHHPELAETIEIEAARRRHA